MGLKHPISSFKVGGYQDHGEGPVPNEARVWTPLTVGFLFASAWNAIAPLVSLQTVALGGDPATVGLVTAAHSVIPLILAIPSGLLIRPPDAKRTMVGACGLAVAAMLVSYTARNPTILALGLVLFGGAQLGISLSTQVAILASNRDARRQVMVGWYFFVLSVGQIIGPIVGSQLAADGSYRRAMLFAAACMMVGLAIALVDSTGRTASGDERTDAGNGLSDLVRERGLEDSLIVTLLAIFAAELAISGWTGFFPLFLESSGSSVQQIGFYFSVRAISAAAVRPFIGPVARRVHPRALVVAVGVAIVIVTAVMFQVRNSYAWTGLAVVLGVSTGLIFPIAAVVVSEALPSRLLGVGIGLRQVTVRMAQLAGPLALGLLSRRWQIPTAFLTYSGFAAFIVLSAALSQSTRQFVNRRI